MFSSEGNSKVQIPLSGRINLPNDKGLGIQICNELTQFNTIIIVTNLRVSQSLSRHFSKEDRQMTKSM